MKKLNRRNFKRAIAAALVMLFVCGNVVSHPLTRVYADPISEETSQNNETNTGNETQGDGTGQGGSKDIDLGEEEFEIISDESKFAIDPNGHAWYTIDENGHVEIDGDGEAFTVEEVFKGNTEITSVHFGDNVNATSIDSWFSDCSNLTAVTGTFPNFTTANNAFRKCSNLVSVPELPSKFSWASNMFMSCTKLSTVGSGDTIHVNALQVAYMFHLCKNLNQNIHFSNALKATGAVGQVGVTSRGSFNGKNKIVICCDSSVREAAASAIQSNVNNHPGVMQFHAYGDDCVDNGDGTHSHLCTVCNAKSEAEDHTFSGEFFDNGDGTHSHLCTVCNALSDPVEHNYGEYTVNEDGTHTHTCQDCGTVKTEVHEYVNHVCVCGEVEKFHVEVKNGYIYDTENATVSDADYKAPVKVTTDSTAKGAWYINDVMRSTKKTFSFNLLKDSIVEWVEFDEDEEVEEVVVGLSVSPRSENGKYIKATFTTTWSLPNNAKQIEVGTYRYYIAKGSDTPDQTTVLGGTKSTSKATTVNGSYSLGVNMGQKKAAANDLCVVAYVTYQIGDAAPVTVYSNIVTSSAPTV